LLAYCDRLQLVDEWVGVLNSIVRGNGKYQAYLATHFPKFYPKIVNFLTWAPHSKLANNTVAFLANTHQSAEAHKQIIKANGHKLMWDYFLYYKQSGARQREKSKYWSAPLMGLHAYSWTVPDSVHPLFKLSELLPLLCDDLTPAMLYSDLMAVTSITIEILSYQHAKLRHPVELLKWFEKVTVV
jgi:hypothetical protein